MSKVQERGLLEALGEAEGLARVLRTMSDGRLDLVPVLPQAGAPSLPLSFEAAKTEARSIAGTLGRRPEFTTRVQETFCSVCGCLDEPGVHPQQDCPRYQRCPRCRSADHDVREFVKVPETRGRMRCPHPWHQPADRAATSRPEGK